MPPPTPNTNGLPNGRRRSPRDRPVVSGRGGMEGGVLVPSRRRTRRTARTGPPRPATPSRTSTASYPTADPLPSPPLPDHLFPPPPPPCPSMLIQLRLSFHLRGDVPAPADTPRAPDGTPAPLATDRLISLPFPSGVVVPAPFRRNSPLPTCLSSLSGSWHLQGICPLGGTGIQGLLSNPSRLSYFHLIFPPGICGEGRGLGEVKRVFGSSGRLKLSPQKVGRVRLCRNSPIYKFPSDTI